MLSPMPAHTADRRPVPSSSVMDLLALRSVTELHVVQRHLLDPEVLRTVAVVDRIGDLTRFNVAEVPELAHVSRPMSTAGRWGTRCPWRSSTGSACG